MPGQDERFMRIALGLAARGLGNTWPNPAVGCVIVKDGRILGRGWTQVGGRPHAETQALAEAGEAARGATAYVTLEPCSHHGRTPPCAEALVEAGVARCVGALEDPDPRVSGKGFATLREAGIERIGIGAYPEGHPHISPERLEAALDEKIAAAAAQGLDVYLASQFSLSPEGIVAWLKQLRACGIDRPVSVGMVGPTSVTALIRFAKRCGVSTSLRGLMSGAATALIGNVGPDRLIEALDVAQGPIGDVHPHYFTFGNLIATADYASAMAGKNATAAIA